MDQILKSPRLKRVGLFCIVIVGLWYGVFRLSIFNCESGPDGNIPYYSPNCAYYVIYRQSLWEKISAPFTWSLATAYLYDKNGKLLYESKLLQEVPLYRFGYQILFCKAMRANGGNIVYPQALAIFCIRKTASSKTSNPCRGMPRSE